MANFNGTANNDMYAGTPEVDLIEGGEGNDQLSGAAGDDIIRGGAGSDTLKGGLGHDQVEGGDGVDYISQDPGDGLLGDEIDGGAGDDSINITVREGDSVTVHGGTGADAITLSALSSAVVPAGSLLIYGDAGADRFSVYRTSGTIDAGADDDLITILSAAGNQLVLTLGSGRDTVAIGEGAGLGTITITDFQAGDSGDILDLDDSFLSLLSQLTNWDDAVNPFGDGHLRVLQSGANTAFQVDFNGGGNSYATVLTLNNVVATSLTAANLGGFSSTGTLSAGISLVGASGADTLQGGTGDDNIQGLGGNDVIQGGVGNDFIDAGDGDDIISGGFGDDVIFAGAGRDSLSDLNGLPGSDTIDMGSGEDFASISVRSGETLTLRGGADNDQLYVRSANNGGTFTASIYGDGGNDSISVGGGTLTVDAGVGDDNVQIDPSENSTITVTLGPGRDIISPFVLQSNSSVVVTDFVAGADGDSVDLARVVTVLRNNGASDNPFAGGYLSLQQSGADTLLQADLNGGGDNFETMVILKGVTASAMVAANLLGYAPDGSLTAQTLSGTNGSETLNGGTGPDIIYGLGGRDTLNGGAGNDLLYGEEGDDILSGGTGNDKIYGGDGNDQLNEYLNSPDDDLVDLGAGNDTASYGFSNGGSVTIYGGLGNDNITAYSGTNSGTSQLFGGDGNDNIFVQLPNATIDAGTGDDIVRVNDLSTINGADSTTGIKTVTLGSGRDTFQLTGFLFGAITITDFQSGTTGDSFDLTSMLSAMTNLGGNANPFTTGHLRLAQSGVDTLVQVDLDGGGNDYRTSTIFANVQASTITAENMSGYAPTVQVIASGGADNITGTGGADNLIGLGGDDRLTGGAGADRLTGGAGNDRFIGTRADLNGDTITDLAVGDRISITDAAFGDFAYVHSGASLSLSNGAALQIGTPNARLATVAGSDGGIDLIAVQRMSGLNDFDGNGHSDILWRHQDGAFSIWQIGGNVQGNQVQINAVLDSSVAKAWQIEESFDFNGDGRFDLLWRNVDNGTLTIWTGTANGFTQNVYVNATVDTSWKIAATGDLNGDGRDDIVWRNANGALTTWQSNGTGFVQNVTVDNSVSPDWQIVGLADFNGDGKDDMLWRNMRSGMFTEWESTGNNFARNVYVNASVDPSWHIDGLGDFNGDGRDDILWRNDGGTFTIWQAGDAGFNANTYVNGSVDSGWQIEQLGDFDDDGKADLLWRNTSTGTFTTWESNGNGFDQNVLVFAGVGTDWQTQHHDFF